MAVTPAIELENVSVALGTRRVLENVSLRILPGELVALLGPSGSGKSSLLRVVLGFQAPETGAVRIDGELVSADGRILRPPEDRGVAMVFQDLALWPHLTVAGNLDFGLAARGVPRPARLERVGAMLSLVGLAERARAHPGELSGGERQRVAIARALVLEPKALLLDEPLSNLDAPLKRELMLLLSELLVERRVPSLYVTHDVHEAAALGDRLAVLEAGRIVQEGTPGSLRAAPATPFVRTVIAELPEHP
jgi:ABC-type Fe3+/spermidine/putrescine transport system ATPase subunit